MRGQGRDGKRTPRDWEGRDGQKQNNAWEPEQGSLALRGKPGKRGLASPLRRVLGKFGGGALGSLLLGEREDGSRRGSRSCPVPPGLRPGLRGAGGARSGRHGGTGPAQRAGHPAPLRAALAGWSLASDRGEEGAVVLAAGAAQPLAVSGNGADPQIQARQRLQMVSAPREREGAPSPRDAPLGHSRPAQGPLSLQAADSLLGCGPPLSSLGASKQRGLLARPLGTPECPQGPRATRGRLESHPRATHPRAGNLEDGKKKGSSYLLCGKCIEGVRPSAF